MNLFQKVANKSDKAIQNVDGKEKQHIKVTPTRVASLRTHDSFKYLKIDLLKTDFDHEFEAINTQIMKYPLIAMRIVGLYHRKTDGFFLKVYSLFCLTLTWINFVRLGFNFNIFYGQTEDFLSADFIMKVCIQLFCFQAAANSTVLYINHEMDTREKKFLNKLNVLIQYDENAEKTTKKLKKKIAIIFILFALLTLGNFFFFIICYFGPKSVLVDNEVAKMFLAPLYKLEAEWALENPGYKALMWLLLVISNEYYVLNISYYLSHCMIIIELFDVFNRKLRESLEVGQEKITEYEFENFRCWHLKLHNVVESFDVCYNKWIGFGLFSLTIMNVIIIFVLSDWTKKLTTVLMQIEYPFWFLFCLVMLSTLLYFTSKLNTMVNIPTVIP